MSAVDVELIAALHDSARCPCLGTIARLGRLCVVLAFLTGWQLAKNRSRVTVTSKKRTVFLST
jgi:hypothetical protein